MSRGGSKLFQNGATWLRADFHLHTKADGTFSCSWEKNDFCSNYVEALEKAGIRIGVITNHNKFDKAEFCALRDNASKREIFLIPGIELSVNDGANGIHVLIVFSEQWLEKGDDYINPFLVSMFPGKTPQQYENNNGRSDKNLLQLVDELNKIGRDYFLVFAHVEEKKGLWHEMDGGKLSDWADKRYDAVRERSLGFQKVRTHDVPERSCRVKVKQWLNNWYPAEVEGSDPKNSEEIGRGDSSYLKVGAFSFDAVKFALIDYASRVAKEVRMYEHSHIKSIHFEGGTLSEKTIYFSPELNTFIGIRGSGKSSILETLRYVLDIPFGEKSGDKKYKQDLVGFTMGSGGKVVLNILDRYGNPCEIRRVWKENYSDVFVGGKLQPGVSIRETVLHKPVYFGQKDLSNTGEGFEKDLVEKLLGSRLDEIRRKIAEQNARVTDGIDRLMKIADVKERIDEQIKIKQDTEHRLTFYKEHGIEEKLQKRLYFDADIRAMKKGIDLVEEFIVGLKELLAQNEDDICNFTGYSSKHNADLFLRFYDVFSGVTRSLETVKSAVMKTEEAKVALSEKYSELVAVRQGLVDEFAEIERKLAEEFRKDSRQNISSGEFLTLKQKLAQTTQLLTNFSKQGEQKDSVESVLAQELQALNDLWHEEFLLVKDELDKIGGKNSALAIASGYKEDRAAFLEFIKSIFKGTGIREATFKSIVDKYPDFISIYTDFEKAKNGFGSNPQLFADVFIKNLKTLLTYQVPNKFTITYRGKELQHHSLGQRASALILFVLSKQEHDVIIIDQPEDDLDNQTIYEDVIKLVCQIKPRIQFIFATHNPNIPVLGDAEQIHACSFMDDCIAVQSGGIDDPAQQKTIVEIMEGGREAFNRRKEIYQIWKP
ncbi:MAG: histidinol-phosphatase [Chlorobium sp.]|nr:MAG: histidinol-phosphatase [Chlorobium sp.]